MRDVEIVSHDLAWDGRPARLVLASDVTERRQLEEALRLRAQILEQTHDAVVTTDLEGLVTSWNPGAERLHGYTGEEMLGRHVTTLYAVEDPASRLAEVAAALTARGNHELELRLRRKAGEPFFAHLSLSLLRDGNGRPVGTIGFAADITERKRAEELMLRAREELELRVRERTAELQAANKELEAFSYSVSHDLRAPLRAINGFSRILLEKHAPHLPPEARGHLEEVRDSAREMGQLVDDLLAFSRLGRQPVREAVVDCAELARECLADLRAEHVGRTVESVVHDLPRCCGDPALLKQVWLNLLSNALKYSRGTDPARIEFGSAEPREAGGEVTYFVRDNGVGFDMRYAHKLFGVFQRLHRAEEYEGTGVGLAIVQRVVHRHGGRVWADARPGEGATFYFTLKGVRGDHTDQ